MSVIAENGSPHKSQFAQKLKPVLIVEDDVNDLLLALRELKALKIQNPLDSVATVDELVAYMTRAGEYRTFDGYSTPAVILLDMHLRQADPLEALSWLRSKVIFRTIPTIAISGTGHTNVLQRAVDLGAVSWMAKPFSGGRFRALTERLRVPVKYGAAHEVGSAVAELRAA